MRQFLIILISLIFLTGWNFISSAVEVAFEAELGKVNPPVKVEKDPKASNGQFIWVPQGMGNADKDPKKHKSGWVDIIIEIPREGTYYLWGRVIAPTGGDDSFFITFDPTKLEDRGVWDSGNENVWDVTETIDWKWDVVSGKLGRGVPQRKFKLSAGVHTLRIWTREDGTKLDALFLSDNPKATPRKPTAAEIDAQKAYKKVTSVSPKGKLTILWGAIKRQY